jgi:hypothetical protein
MTIDTEILTIFVIVFTLTVLMWINPLSRSLLIGDLSKRERAAKAAVAARRPLVRLTKPTAAQAVGDQRDAGMVTIHAIEASVSGASGEESTHRQDGARPASGHMARLNQIVSSAVDCAQAVERLHRTAHEQVDSAHYALQNLLNELSAVMPITAPNQTHRDVASIRPRAQLRAVYETALAA